MKLREEGKVGDNTEVLFDNDGNLVAVRFPKSVTNEKLSNIPDHMIVAGKQKAMTAEQQWLKLRDEGKIAADSEAWFDNDGNLIAAIPGGQISKKK